MTWPLCLGRYDLSLLAPLSELRVLHLYCGDDEEHNLLSLTTCALSTLSTEWRHLQCLHYSGAYALRERICVRECAHLCLC